MDQRQLPLNGSYTYNRDGSGVTVYVIDTGLNPSHVDFQGRVLGGRNFVGNDPGDWSDCNGHGTHVAGTAAGTQFGIAKGANIAALRVLGCNGSGSTSDIIESMDWLAQQSGSRIANMSLGGPNSAARSTAISRLANSGVLVVAAAGNENQNACNVWPASSSLTLTVGATDRNDNRASFSNFGPCVDVFSPGVQIPSASSTSNAGSRTLSGTSMASPLVAGIGALFMQDNPNASANQIKQAVITASTTNVVGNANGSPNRLAFGQFGSPPPAPTPTPLSLIHI